MTTEPRLASCNAARSRYRVSSNITHGDRGDPKGVLMGTMQGRWEVSSPCKPPLDGHVLGGGGGGGRGYA